VEAWGDCGAWERMPGETRLLWRSCCLALASARLFTLMKSRNCSGSDRSVSKYFTQLVELRVSCYHRVRQFGSRVLQLFLRSPVDRLLVRRLVSQLAARCEIAWRMASANRV